MIFIVEDGTGLPDANAYISIAYVTDYFSPSQLSRWTLLTLDQQEVAIIISSQFIDLSYSWIGERGSYEQGLNWPRTGVSLYGTDITGVPNQVKKATAEAVWLLIQQGIDTPLFELQADAQVKKEALGPMSTEYFEKVTGAIEGATKYTILNQILSGLYAKKLATGMSGVWISPVERA